MPPKKKRTTEAAKAPATPVKTPLASPAKAAPSPTPTRKSSSSASPARLHHHHHGSTPSISERDRQRSHSVHEAGTPKRPSSSSPSQSPRTPERQGSHNHHGANRSQTSGGDVAFVASPSVPPAPATTPVPAGGDKTPWSAHSRSEARREGSSHSNDTSQRSKSAVLSLSASPVLPPAPPTTPVPVAKRASTSEPPPSQQQSTLSETKNRATSVRGSTPAKLQKASPGAVTKVPSPQRVEGAVKNAAVWIVNAEQKTRAQKPLSRNVRRQRSRRGEGESSSLSLASPTLHAVEHLIRESKVIAPDVSGLRCLAVHPSEQQVVVGRENGSLVLYDVSFFQNIPQFVQRRHTGGQMRRTISSLAYVEVPAPTSISTTRTISTSSVSSTPVNTNDSVEASADATAPSRYVLLASMMSGQIVVYDADLLVPIALHQRSGGAIWQLTVVSPSCIYAAMADGSWQHLRLTCHRDGAAPQVELVRVVPGVSGADRALTVATSLSLRMAVGSDDAGNVHAWKLLAKVEADGDGSAATAAAGATRSRGLTEHESLWTTKLAKGVALSCAVVGGTQRPCVVVGTSMGDVVLLDAAHGHVFQTFSQHKGPVTTLAVYNDAVVFASGWHESLRSYRCSSEGDWHPAEVKRRTHYHEASQLAVMPHRRLILSASRDGTIMYAPIAQLFHAPSMYVAVTTQQFAYAAGRRLLLQSRFDTIEAFSMDGACRHWVPFFGHRLEGRFHLSGLWCDAQLHYILFSTEERVGLLKVVWRAQAAMSIARIEEVLELPARTGVADVCWSSGAQPLQQPQPDSQHCAEGFHENKTNNNEEEKEAACAAAASSSSSDTTTTAEAAPRVLYVLYDDCVTSVTLADGYPIVNTVIQVRGKGLLADSLRPHRVFCRPIAEAASKKQKPAAAAASAQELVIYGHRGSCRLQLMADGTPDAATLVADLDDVYDLVQEVPVLRRLKKGSDGDREGEEPRRAKKAKGETCRVDVAEVTAIADVGALELVGLSAVQQRYVAGQTLHSAAASTVPLPSTLPHDVRWVARVPLSSGSSYRYLGYFSRGLLVASGDSWHMVRRMNVEAAFVVKDGSEVLVLERNLEKTLEALPLSWKVRRFGN